ncbi:GNAT family acetyltransferase, putative [Talaromyces stipitatus ATCC 10500]|uniref:GNAT family acetyltransferase, putative n=1 Tax=Talaromyces stipitatus (strain ATCC 10500 / CBS 375.48 / QM 6759 / NRRL 1006) TaxID=441959 RepID=B8MSA5_TALSN|nr:GNAT family acetyltransferase, putative [Talaromyces stipitatus ATCC 10500]EED12238.1 GNAT family acetyltransferase, putative [Talaromyces stipitatus ATCC 10500]
MGGSLTDYNKHLIIGETIPRYTTMTYQPEQISDFIILNQNPTDALIPALESHLPTSLPVLRRIQYDRAHPRQTAYYVVSANLTTSQSSTNSKSGEPWMAAYIDLFAGKETQVWVYSSLEAEIPPTEHIINGDNDEEISDFSTISLRKQDIAREQTWTLLQWIHRELVPNYMSHVLKSDSQNESTEGPEQKIKVIPKHNPPAILLGSLHTGLMRLLTTNDSYISAQFRQGLKVHRYDTLPYVKYIFAPEIFQTSSNDENESNPLPEGYYYGTEGLRPQHVDLVKSRTHIPRERETLLAMPSAVVYRNTNNNSAEQTPIAWGFLAFDGSLATLHVEPEHRGKGIAVILSREVMRRGMASGVYGSDSKRLGYAHADVARNNVASRRVMEKVGGGIGWRWSVTWAVVEIVDK